MKRFLPVLAIAASLAAGPALAGAGGPEAVPAAVGAGVFVTPCHFSHSAPDDPIVAFGRPGASHDHDFFGNNSTSSRSTFESLRRAGTTCFRPKDTAAYWAPSLLDDGQVVRPRRAQIYYRAVQRDRLRIRPHPPGLRIIAGDAAAGSPQPGQATDWHCAPDTGLAPSAAPPTCPPGSHLVLRVRFPDCWDGRNLDSPDHRSHMAYGRFRGCPASQPVSVPRIVLNVSYPIRGGDRVELASGGRYSGHADFFNAWDQNELRRLVAVCINGAAGEHSAPCRAPRPPRPPRR